jgi:Fe-S-cluster containining protein
MIRINCETCGARCCMDPLAPILLPEEEEVLKDISVVVGTPFRKMRVIPKREDGSCVFLDEDAQACRIYERRPFECRIYPFLLDFEKGPHIQLDPLICPNLGSVRYDITAVGGLVDVREWPEDWINAYQSMDG